MMKFNGYYIFEPFPFLDKKEEKIIDFSAQAFLFQDNGIVISSQKWVKDENDADFSIEDFKEENGKYNYTLKDNELCLIKYVTPEWESKFYYNKISDEEFINRQTGKSIKFVPWKKDEYKPQQSV